MALHLSFLGGAGTVTGSKYALQNGRDVALVDCGLFQGFKTLRLKNWAPLPIDPRKIAAVVLTHAHLDHSGYLPLLVRNGFRGPIFASRPTLELCRILLPDSGLLQEKDAEFANRHGFSKHKPALPLYTAEDARRSLDYFKPVSFDDSHALTRCDVVSHASRRAHPRRRFGADRGRRHDDRVLRRSRPLRRSDHGRSGRLRSRRLSGRGVHLWRPAPSGRRSGRRPWRRHRDDDRARRHGRDPGLRGRPDPEPAVPSRAAEGQGTARQCADLPRQPDGAGRQRHLLR